MPPLLPKKGIGPKGHRIEIKRPRLEALAARIAAEHGEGAAKTKRMNTPRWQIWNAMKEAEEAKRTKGGRDITRLLEISGKFPDAARELMLDITRDGSCFTDEAKSIAKAVLLRLGGKQGAAKK